MAVPLMELRGVSKAYGDNVALWDLNLSLYAGEAVLMTGANASGKSTALAVIGGLCVPEAGEIFWQGRRVRAPRLSSDVAMCFQKVGLFQEESVFANIVLGRNGLGGLRPTLWMARHVTCACELEALREEATALLAELGLADRIDHPVNQLSFGNQRVVELLRAFLSGAPLLLLDEPLAGLGTSALQKAVSLLVRARSKGRAILTVAHGLDASLIAHFDRHVELESGRLVRREECGTPTGRSGRP